MIFKKRKVKTIITGNIPSRNGEPFQVHPENSVGKRPRTSTSRNTY